MAAGQGVAGAQRASRVLPWLAAVPAAVAAGALGGHALPTKMFVVIVVLAIVGGLFVMVWNIDPAWRMSAAIVMPGFNGHWKEFGLPPLGEPARLLRLAFLPVVFLRAPAFASARGSRSAQPT